ncbi:uncharacterized protein MELLADRAFT_117452 [Melampsora larici-populina 98AG31]|uniref:UBL3-like ubiquitin domain-containing protein n=1 Tax=Melampsora larici-populina (strain 98AG31 / pathotype 3-4-7) TaxID=747676 RepID=F4RXB2_MELLP|nr:uncharacterized protein MELLADRAFT_117452 [Melampsora larici-populina 98AG31]EGG02936.1 hypothetical protein MELLADRAFT_117452 [Melampsora larici-populina 98AG31]
MNQMSQPTNTLTIPAPVAFRQKRPTSAVSTTSTIIDQPHSIASTSLNQSLLQTTADYEHRLKLIDENRSKLNLQDSHSSSDLILNRHHLPHQNSRRRVTFDDDHPVRPIKIEFVFASSTKPNLNRLNLSFDSHSKALDIKHRIKSSWPTGWSTEGITPKGPDEIKLLFLGRFLNDSEALDSLRLANGSPTIMHLLLRPNNPDPQLTKEWDHKFIKWNCCCTTTTSETDETTSQCCIIS